MKKAFSVLLILCLALTLIAPKYIGQQVERGVKDYLHSKDVIALQQYGISFDLVQYDRGYFSSRAIVALQIASPPQLPSQSLGQSSSISVGQSPAISLGQSQPNPQPLLTNQLIVDITHAPFSLSGMHLLEASVVNHKDMSVVLSESLPADFIQAEVSVSLLGQVSEKIALKPFTFTANDFALKHLDFGGATIDWHAHIKDIALNGHGMLTTPHIALENKSEQTWRVNQLSAQLRLQDSVQTLNIDELNVSYQHPEQEMLHINAQGIAQMQHFAQSEQQRLPLHRTLSIEQVNIALDNVPMLQINNLFGKVGLTANESAYDLVLNWQASVTRHESFNESSNQQALPFFAALPAEQQLSLTLAPISSAQLPAWSYVIESFWQPSVEKSQSLANFGQLLRLNVAEERMLLSLKATLSDPNQLLADADIVIDENIDDAGQINTMFKQGLNPQWFNDSHIDVRANQAWLRKRRLLPYLLFLKDKGLHIDDDSHVSLHAKIVDHQLLLNDEPPN